MRNLDIMNYSISHSRGCPYSQSLSFYLEKKKIEQKNITFLRDFANTYQTSYKIAVSYLKNEKKSDFCI